jgi:two-component sensor histidine kinase
MNEPTAARGLANPSRLSALQRTNLLDTPPEARFDRVTGLLADLLKADVALLSLVTGDRQFFKSQCGLPDPSLRETPLSHSFCQHVVMTRQPLRVSDARDDPVVAGNLAITELGVVAYLGVPVHARSSNEILGSLCIIQTKPRDWSDADLALLRQFGDIIEDQIDVHAYAKAARDLAAENALLAREYHHRIKNTLAVSAALVSMSARGAGNIGDVVADANRRLNALAAAHDTLIVEQDTVDLANLAERLLTPYGPSGTRADVGGPAVALNHRQVTPICLFLHELATNSAKYGALREQSRIAVRWHHTSTGQLHLLWSEHLSRRPSGGAGGFGSQLLETVARQLDGRLTASWNDPVHEVALQFPLGDERAAHNQNS